MKAIDQPLKKIINGSSQFVIPVFQRDYKWEEEQCRQLWNDVLRSAASSSDQGHFRGSLVYIPTDDTAATFPRYLLIDGQQRLTTLSLLLAALRDSIEESNWRGDQDAPTVARINSYFLVNSDEDGDRRRKLVLRRQDDATLAAIVDKTALPEHPSERVLEAYELFEKVVAEADPAVVYAGINKLVIVDVSLNRLLDDPQLVFESLNSTGKDLSPSDLIRNFILMRLPEKDQTRLYNANWNKIEALFAGSDHAFNAFIRDYIALRTRASKQDKSANLYFAFRGLWQRLRDKGKSIDEALLDMQQVAEDHAAFSLGRGIDEKFREALLNVRELSDVAAILITRLLHSHRRTKTLTSGQMLEALGILESYLLRRSVRQDQSRAYWQHFANTAYALQDDQPLDSLKLGIARLPVSYRMPDDKEFSAALEGHDIYNLRVCRFLLERLENDGTLEPSLLDNCTIEHILPQNTNLKREWRTMLGPDWKAVQAENVDRLGNLTLTAYNTRYSDHPFETKKTLEHGFSDSAVRLNKFVREQKQWTDKEIAERGKLLVERCMKIWRKLEVSPQLLQEANEQSLKEKAALSALTPVAISERAAPLVAELMTAIKALGTDVVHINHKASLSFHAREFFLEVIPRKRRITLILPLDFGSLKSPPEIANDFSDFSFIINAQHDGGTILSLKTIEDVNAAWPFVQQAYTSAS